MIEFEDVRIAYKDKPVLDGVSLTIHDREFFVLIVSLIHISEPTRPY